MRQDDEKLANTWDELHNAIQRVSTSLPSDMSERIGALDAARINMRDVMNAFLLDRGRPNPDTEPMRRLAGEFHPGMDKDSLTSWAEAATAALDKLCAAVDETPKYSVYDWEYEGSNGKMEYARTPERAERLMKMGAKLTPVYVPDRTLKQGGAK